MIDARRYYFVINTQLYLFMMITSGLLVIFDSFINLLVINSLLIFSLSLLLFMEIVRPSITFFVAVILELYTPSMACKTGTLTKDCPNKKEKSIRLVEHLQAEGVGIMMRSCCSPKEVWKISRCGGVWWFNWQRYPLVNVFRMVAPLFAWSYHDDKQTCSNSN